MSALSDRLPVILSVAHVVLFLTTMFFGERIASGGNPLFCVDLPASLPLVARDDTPTVVIVGALATAWWYFIGQIGRASWKGKMSRMMSMAGALLLLLLETGAWFAMVSEFRLISQQPHFGGKDVVVYILAVALLLGGLVSASCAFASGLGFHRN